MYRLYSEKLSKISIFAKKQKMATKTRAVLSILIFVIPFIALTAQPGRITLLDDYIAKARQDWNVPGLAVGIIKDGEVALAKGYGALEEGGSGMADGQTVFAIASNTKAFISTAIAILVEEGKLGWDDPVRKHLPWFALYNPYVSENTTVRDLLCHRVGLGTFSGDVIWYKSKYSAEETVRRARHVPQDFGFRAGYGYSNLMFIAAGEVIEAVSGKSWSDFIRERIFQPLGMNRTFTSVEDLKSLNNIASPHKPIDGKNTPIPYVNWDNMGAAGGILSSVEDMLKWLQLQIDQGSYNGKQFFSRGSQIETWTPHSSFRVSDRNHELFRNRNFSGYGLGWSLADYAGRLAVSHGGGYDGMYSRVVIVPREKLGVVVLTNSMTGISSALANYIIDHYLGLESKDWSAEGLTFEKRNEEFQKSRIKERLDAQVYGTTPSFSLDKYAGHYRCDMFGEIEIAHQDGQLKIRFPDAPDLNASLSHWHYDTFRINWEQTHAWFDFGTVQFVTGNNREILELSFDVPNDDIFFHEIKAKKKG